MCWQAVRVAVGWDWLFPASAATNCSAQSELGAGIDPHSAAYHTPPAV